MVENDDTSADTGVDVNVSVDVGIGVDRVTSKYR